jgi:myo-inositol catabolism protein IolH
MKLALDPYMFRRLPLTEMVHTVADIGYEHIELSPREDFFPFFLHPRADRARVLELKTALRETGVQLASLLPLYRWSAPDEDARQAAVRYWKRAIEIAVELECPVMNSEFNGRPEGAAESEAQFWRSMETLLPIFERENITLHLEAHPDDFIEQNTPALEMIRGINSSRVRYLYCAPHTFHLGEDVGSMLREAAPLLGQVHIADSFNHKASSGLRYIINPPGSLARIHQHLDIGQGDVPWDAFFGTLREIGFDGIATACVFAWEERARDSSVYMLEQIRTRLTTTAHSADGSSRAARNR